MASASIRKNSGIGLADSVLGDGFKVNRARLQAFNRGTKDSDVSERNFPEIRPTQLRSEQCYLPSGELLKRFNQMIP